MNGRFHRTRPGDHFPEHGLDLLAYTVFIKIGKEQTLIGQNRLQLVFEGLRVTTTISFNCSVILPSSDLEPVHSVSCITTANRYRSHPQFPSGMAVSREALTVFLHISFHGLAKPDAQPSGTHPQPGAGWYLPGIHSGNGR